MNKIVLVTGIILVILLSLLSINSSFYYLKILKVKPIEWIMFNACVPSSTAYIIGFIIFILTGNKSALGIGILTMFFFGTMGLFVFSWGGMSNIVQLGHITMTLNILWGLYATISSSDYKALAIGLIIGILIYTPFIGYQQSYVLSHFADAQRILKIK